MKNKNAVDYATQTHPRFSEECEPLLKNFPVRAFFYMEYLSDATYFAMGTDLVWTNYMLSMNEHGEIWDEIVSASITKANSVTSSVFSTLQSNDPHAQRLCEKGHPFGINIYQKTADKVRLYAFTGQDIQSLLFFQTQKDLLEKFIFHFQDNCRDLITADRIKQNTAHWATPMKCDITKGIPASSSDHSFLHPKAITLYHDGRESSLTLNQWEVLKKYAQGYAMKRIANDLGVSPRTIESTLERIKSKCDVSCKLDLIQLVKQNNFGGL